MKRQAATEFINFLQTDAQLSPYTLERSTQVTKTSYWTPSPTIIWSALVHCEYYRTATYVMGQWLRRFSLGLPGVRQMTGYTPDSRVRVVNDGRLLPPLYGAWGYCAVKPTSSGTHRPLCVVAAASEKTHSYHKLAAVCCLINNKLRQM